MNPNASTLARQALAAGPAAGLPGHAGALLDRHLPAGLCRHCAQRGRHAGADAADAVELPARLCADEPVPRRAVRQRRPPARGAGGRGGVHAGSLGCALSQTIGQLVFWRAVQGMSAGAGMVVSRAIIRDMFAPADAQRVMSQVTIYFGIAPAVAPLVGGFCSCTPTGMPSSGCWCCWACAVAGLLALAARDPAPEARQPFRAGNLLRGYCATAAQPALRGPGVCQRRALQRHVPVRAVGAGVAG
jgi:MFS family permease